MIIDAPDYPSLPMAMTGVSADPLLAWAGTALAGLGYRITDTTPEIRRRDWSIVIAVPTDRGRVWAKANARQFAFEAGLLTLLARVTPEYVLHPIAVDLERGWFLTADGGQVLDAGGPPREDQWVALLTEYADLQAAVAPHVEQLLALGLLDMTPGTIVGWYRRVLDRVRSEPTVSCHFSPAQLLALDGLVPVTDALARELADSAVPISVEHNDLHTDNVFRGDIGTAGLRIFDWADAVVTHPFVGLGRALQIGGASDSAGTEPGGTGRAVPIDPELLREAYLRRWLPVGTTEIPEGLRRASVVAEVLSDVTLAASWLRLPHGFLPDWGRYFADFVASYLRRAEIISSQAAARWRDGA